MKKPFEILRQLSPKEAAEQTGFHEKVLRQFCSDDPPCPHGRGKHGAISFDADELTEYIERLALEPGSGGVSDRIQRQRQRAADGFWKRFTFVPYVNLDSGDDRVEQRINRGKKSVEDIRIEQALASGPETCCETERAILSGENVPAAELRKYALLNSELRYALIDGAQTSAGWLAGQGRTETSARLRAIIGAPIENFLQRLSKNPPPGADVPHRDRRRVTNQGARRRI